MRRRISGEETRFAKFPFINDKRVQALSEVLRGSVIRPIFVSPGNLYSALRVRESRMSSNLGVPGVVYKFVCRSCGNSYIGYTQKQLMVRVGQHVRPSSPLYKSHARICPDYIHKSGFSVIDSGRSLFELKVKEAYHIRVVAPVLNGRVEGLSYRLRL